MNDSDFFLQVKQTLVSRGIVKEEAIRAIDALMSEKGLEFEHALDQAAGIDPKHYRDVLEDVSGYAALDPSQIAIDDEFIEAILDVLPLECIVGLRVFPISLGANELTLALQNPTNTELIEALEALTSLRIRPVATTSRGLQTAIQQNFRERVRDSVRAVRGLTPEQVLASVFRQRQAADPTSAYERFITVVNREFNPEGSEDELRQFLGSPTVVSCVQQMLTDIVLKRGSDIHIEPGPRQCRLRTRVNGVMETVRKIPKKAGEVVQMRTRLMAGLPLRETASPLDGQINYSPVYGRNIEFRVSVLPTINGSKTVLRLLEKSNQTVALDRIGLSTEDLRRVQRNIVAPNGLILITGPTGSGKTSTLYSILNVLNNDENCIVTAEEPVESELEGIVQVSCNKDCTFPMALRSFLRQDPDIIMVGEIRDTDSADIALRAALTGHLVLSTLHTNDAPTAIYRLLDLKVDPFVVASSVRLIMAQRLMRVLCDACKIEVKRDKQQEAALHGDLGTLPETIFAKNGCSECNGTGFSGRTGIYEILEQSDALTEAVNNRSTLTTIRDIAARTGMRTLRESALELCASGRTTVEEVIRVTSE
jgi:type IV pilus assembly protein PilB